MPQDNPAGYYRGVKSSLLETRPYGRTFGDKETELRNALMDAHLRDLEAQQQQAETARIALMRKDPSIAQQPELDERMANRRDVRRISQEPARVPEPPRVPESVPGGPVRMPRSGGGGGYEDAEAALPALVRNIRSAQPKPSLPTAKGIRGFKAGDRFESGGLVSLKQDADQINDPNYETVRRERERSAIMDPSVLSAQARAAGTVEAAQIRASGSGQQGDDNAPIMTNLARLGSIAMQLNQQGGPSGVVSGAIRRHITGPSQTDELAREFAGIRGATALAIAAKLNQGRPTEADRQAAEGLLPAEGDGPDLVRRKMRLVLNVLGSKDADSITDPLSGERISLTGGAAEEAGAGGANVGNIVQYQGKPHRIVAVVNGVAELEPVR